MWLTQRYACDLRVYLDPTWKQLRICMSHIWMVGRQCDDSENVEQVQRLMGTSYHTWYIWSDLHERTCDCSAALRCWSFGSTGSICSCLEIDRKTKLKCKERERESGEEVLRVFGLKCIFFQKLDSFDLRLGKTEICTALPSYGRSILRPTTKHRPNSFYFDDLLFNACRLKWS